MKGAKGKVKLPNGNEMWWKDNRNFEDRVWDKTLGQVKYQLVEKAGCKKEDVKIDWDTGTVKVKKGKEKTKVAEVDADAKLTVWGKGEEIKSEVGTFISEWREGREL